MTGVSTSGVPQFAQPSFSNLSGSASTGQLPVYGGGSSIGIVPSGGTNSTYLRGDGSWVTPSGGGGSLTIGSSSVSGGTAGDILTVGTGPILQQVANIPLSASMTQYLSDNFGAY
jgi:hypothetical protein